MTMTRRRAGAAGPAMVGPAAEPVPAPAWVDLSPRNPLRPLDWRWQMATLGEGDEGRPRWLRGDAWTRRARRYIGRMHGREAKTGQGPGEVDRPLAAADRLRSSALKGEVELRLLGGQDDATIAARCGLDAGVVAAYGHLFYDVRPLFGHTDALLFTTVGSRLYDDDGGGVEATLKLLAIHGGPFVVDHLLGGPGEARTADRQFPEVVRVLTQIRAVDAEGPAGKLLLRLFARMVAADREDAGAAGDVALARSVDLAGALAHGLEESGALGEVRGGFVASGRDGRRGHGAPAGRLRGGRRPRASLRTRRTSRWSPRPWYTRWAV